MPYSSVGLVKELIAQLKKFTGLWQGFDRPLPVDDLAFSVELSYSWITFSVKQSGTVYFEYAVHQDPAPGKTECYCDDPAKKEDLKRYFESFAAGLHRIYTHRPHDRPAGPLDTYLATADAIATHGYLCASGDNYHPGFFSKIIVDGEWIILEQVNKMNSRSLDHKHNYTMRELEFHIPLLMQPPMQQPFVGRKEYDIGIMRVCFSDRSSAVNRTCGDKILEAIEMEKRRFEEQEQQS